MENNNLLEIKDLKVSFFTPAGEVKAVDGISYEVRNDETMGIVGESGSGKSVEAYSIIGLLQSPGKVTNGEILFEGEDVLKYSEDQMREFRGNKVSMIFQNPMTCMNPVYTIGDQLCEALICHNKDVSKKEAREKAIEMLSLVGINNPDKRFNQYPHELSGGMRQRVMIAMALACKPKLLIADEPTTALDVTIQAQILYLMNELKKELGTSILFITHDLGVINQMADDVAVMYCGQIVEMSPRKTIFSNPEYMHPYTEGLFNSIPRLDTDANTRLESIPGAVPHPLNLPKGCKFAPRCKYCTEKCLNEEPDLVQVNADQQIRCFYPKKEDRHVTKQ